MQSVAERADADARARAARNKCAMEAVLSESAACILSEGSEGSIHGSSTAADSEGGSVHAASVAPAAAAAAPAAAAAALSAAPSATTAPKKKPRGRAPKGEANDPSAMAIAMVRVAANTAAAETLQAAEAVAAPLDNEAYSHAPLPHAMRAAAASGPLPAHTPPRARLPSGYY